MHNVYITGYILYYYYYYIIYNNAGRCVNCFKTAAGTGAFYLPATFMGFFTSFNTLRTIISISLLFKCAFMNKINLLSNIKCGLNVIIR